MGLRVVPCELSEANAVVSAIHRHHAPVVGHRFSLAAVDDDGTVRGVAIAGRPVARLAGHPREVLEVTRLASDGTRNVCSCLLGAVARIAKSMGYVKVQTYTLDSESGVSLRAAGWVCDGPAGGGSWRTISRPDRREDQPMGTKTRWSKTVNAPAEYVRFDTYDNVKDLQWSME